LPKTVSVISVSILIFSGKVNCKVTVPVYSTDEDFAERVAPVSLTPEKLSWSHSQSAVALFFKIIPAIIVSVSVSSICSRFGSVITSEIFITTGKVNCTFTVPVYSVELAFAESVAELVVIPEKLS
jgi:hypothetical protein